MSDTSEPGRLHVSVSRLLGIEPGEVAVVLLGGAYHFCLLSGYYIVRPLRDEIGTADRPNLQVLWTAVFLVMLAAVPIYGALTARLSRGRFVPLVHHFFALNLLAFFGLMFVIPDANRIWVERVFYVWASVFNLFVVSIFWSYMADLLDRGQGKRVFGLLALGGTLGAIVGGSITRGLLAVESIERVHLLLVAMVLLELAGVAAWRMGKLAARRTDLDRWRRERDEPSATEPLRGSVIAGLTLVLRSRYLLAICGILFAMTLTATFYKFIEAKVVGDVFGDDRDGAASFFAGLDILTNVLTVLIQLLAAGRLMSRFGVMPLLVTLPIVTMLGLAALAVQPILAVLVVGQVARRASNYAVSKPAREVLFTVVGREAKYKSKSFIDTAVYRGGDMVSAWIFTLFETMGLAMAGIASIALIPTAAWLGLAVWAGRRVERG